MGKEYPLIYNKKCICCGERPALRGVIYCSKCEEQYKKGQKLLQEIDNKRGRSLEEKPPAHNRQTGGSNPPVPNKKRGRQANLKNIEKKKEAFSRLFSKRMDKIVENLRILSNLSGPNYAWDYGSVSRSFDELRNRISEIEEKFNENTRNH